MNIEFVARNNVQLDDRIRQHVAEKLHKVERLLEEPIEVRVTLDLERHRAVAELHIAHRLGILQAREETDSLLTEAINQAMEKAETQARRSHQKLVDQRRRAPRDGHRWPMEVLDQTSLGTGVPPRVIESTHLDIKPMTIEEAALELDGTKKGFVVFLDASTERVSVLYRRDDSHYGLIAPEL